MNPHEGWLGPLPHRDGALLLRAALDPDAERASRTLKRWWAGRDAHRVPGALIEVAVVAGERLGDPPAVGATLRSWRRWSAARTLVAVDLAERLHDLAARRGHTLRPFGDLATRELAGDVPWRWAVRRVELLILPAGSDGSAEVGRLREDLLTHAGVITGIPLQVVTRLPAVAGRLDAATHLRSLVRGNWSHRPPGGLRWLVETAATLEVLLGPLSPTEAGRELMSRAPAASWEVRALISTLHVVARMTGDPRFAVMSVALGGAGTRAAARVRGRVLAMTARPPLTRLRGGAR